MKLRTRVFALLIAILCLFSYFVPAFAHDCYSLTITIDVSTLRYNGKVKDESKSALLGLQSNAATWDDHKEYKLKAILSMFDGWTESHLTEYKNLLANGATKAEWKDFYHGDADDNTTGTLGMKEWDAVTIPDGACFALSFPGYHMTGTQAAGGCAPDLSNNDKKLAQRANKVADELSSALGWVKTKCWGSKNINANDLKIMAVQLAIGARTKTAQTINGKTVTFSAAAASSPEIDTSRSLTASDYVTITIGEESTTVCWRCPKGYKSTGDGRTDSMKVTHGEKYQAKLNAGGDAADPTWITWDIIVVSGNCNSDVKGVTYGNEEAIEEPSPFVKLVGELLEWIVDTLTESLGLKDYYEFFLIQGDVNAWVYGIFPSTWLEPAMLLYAISLTISTSLIGFSILKILWKKQLSTVNIGEKIAMQESIKNLIVTMFLFFAFIPIFIFIAGLNVGLVKLFGSSVNGASLGDISISYLDFGSIALGIADLILRIYFNFFYITRGITVAALLGVAPLAIYTLSLGGKTSGVFTAYMKELISQIFTQTVHAMMSAFFFNLTSAQQLTQFEQIVVLYAFIPVTKFIKTKVFQLTEGPAGQVAQQGANLAAGAMSGAAKATGDLAKGKGRPSDDHGGHHGGGGSGGEGSLSGVMDRTAGQQRSNAAKSGNAPTLEDKTATGRKSSGYRNVYSSKSMADGAKPDSGFQGSSVNEGKQFDVSGLNRQALGNFGKAALHSVGNVAAGGLYGGLALGMGAIGENPSKYAEASARHYGVGQAQGAMALYDNYQYGRAGGIRDQQIMAMEQAGINGISTNGSFNRYNVETPDMSDSTHSDKDEPMTQHQAVYNDLRQAYTKTGDSYTEQQKAAQAYYRDNYGVVNVTATGDRGLQIDMEAAKMQAHRISEVDPFEQMKTFKWKDEKK